MALGWALNPVTGILIRRRQTHRKDHVKTEVGRDWSNAAIGQRIPGASRAKGAGKDSSLEPSEGAQSTDPLISDFWPPEP